MPRPQPTNEQARELTLAVAADFGPCHCNPRGGHMCAGHAFLLDDPTRRGLVKTWQRLLFMRAQRSALLAQEGTPAHSPEPAATPAAQVLPW